MTQKMYEVWLVDHKTEKPKKHKTAEPGMGYRTERACMMAYAFELRSIAAGHREQARKNIEMARDSERLAAKIRKQYK